MAIPLINGRYSEHHDKYWCDSCVCYINVKDAVEYDQHQETVHNLDVKAYYKTINNKQKQKDVDMVNHPPHYTFGKYEVIDVLMDWFANDPLLWQVTKYVARARRKGNSIEDLKKARFYLDKAIVELEAVPFSISNTEKAQAIRDEHNV